MIVHEAPRHLGPGAEIAATVAERGLLSLQAPIERVDRPRHDRSLPRLEKAYMPSEKADRRSRSPRSELRMKTFNLPDLGEGLHEVEIINWHVSVGDNVVVDQPLVSVETDKAVVEVPSPYSGRIAALHGKPGDIVPIGQKLAEFDDGATQQQDSGTVVGTMPVVDTRGNENDQRERVSGARVKAMPAVRALARKLGVDLIAVDPTGADGMITADDVKRYASALADVPAEPLHGVRRAMANKMQQAHAEIVPASIHDEADVESWIDKGDVTVRLIRAIVAGCRVSPVLNAWYNSPDMTLRIVRIDRPRHRDQHR